MAKGVLVLYHAQCNDGFGAAWAAFRKLGRKAEYVPVHHGDRELPAVDGKDVWILDFAFPRPVLLDLKERAKSLLVLDHHVTAKEDLEGLEFAHFDLERSGAVLAWQHFHPDLEVPWLLEYIEDRDLWNWKLPRSDEIAAALQSYPRTFPSWQKIVDKGFEALVAEGAPIVRYRRRLVEAASSRTRMVELDGHKVPLVTSCLLQSEIGSRLSKNHPFVVVMFEMQDRRVYSLRSHPDSGVDVAKIAVKFGGGGHPNAAGFTVPMDDEPNHEPRGR